MIYRNPLLEDVEIVNDQYFLRNPGYTNDKTLNALHTSYSIFYNKPILEMFGLGTYKDQNVIDSIDEVLDELIDYDVIENAFELKDINLIIKYGHLT